MSLSQANHTLYFFRLARAGQFLLIAGMALLLYLPIIGNSFLNDDFIVLKRLGADGQFLAQGFFRPLSDLTLYLTYQLAGQHACWFYLTGIIGHSVAVYLLMRLCLVWSWTDDERQQQLFALLAGLLFLTYPFHNESVAWILGRGALMANTLGILAFWILVRPGSNIVKMAVVAGCYFIALGAYESVIVLPAMIVLYLLVNRQAKKLVVSWILLLSGTLGLHLLLRRQLTGSFTGNYGDGFLQDSGLQYLVRYGKAFARSFLPPFHDERVMMGATLALLLILALIILALSKKGKKDIRARRFLSIQAGCFLIALLIPAIGAVSTRTSESDRFLHFPSFFVAIMLAYVLVVLPYSVKHTRVIAVVLILTQICLLELNNLRWRKASDAVTYVLSMAKAATADHPLYVINLPEQIDGAFVFRVGFREALQLNGVQADHLQVLSNTAELPGNIPPEASVIIWQKNGWQRIR